MWLRATLGAAGGPLLPCCLYGSQTGGHDRSEVSPVSKGHAGSVCEGQLARSDDGQHGQSLNEGMAVTNMLKK